MRFALALLLLWTAFSGVPCKTPPSPAPDRPNILFILTDDQRWDTMGCYGNAGIRTPNFDRIASEGARLDAYYVAYPLCCPSRAILLSGQYPSRTGIIDNSTRPLPADLTLLPTMFNDAGYSTGLVGKTHLDGKPLLWGFQEAPIFLPGGQSKYTDPTLTVNGVSKIVQGDITQIFTDGAIDFIERHQTQPWFLWLAYNAPHTPTVSYAQFPYTRQGILNNLPPGWPPALPLSTDGWTSYYSTISYLDDQIGRILARLDQLGLAQNTFIFVMSDNGLMKGSHGYFKKRLWFEESSRMPALARWPARINAGTVVKGLASSVDFVPTVLEVAGAANPGDLAGVSLLQALTGGASPRTHAYSEAQRSDADGGGYWDMVRRDDGWKLVRFRGSGKEHLYNLVTDPHELQDVIGRPENAALAAELRARLLSRQAGN
jgi:arylsulfatase A-like enzyme